MDFEALTEKAQGWADQLIVWMQSPPFLAQLAAIGIAIILAPILFFEYI